MAVLEEMPAEDVEFIVQEKQLGTGDAVNSRASICPRTIPRFLYFQVMFP